MTVLNKKNLKKNESEKGQSENGQSSKDKIKKKGNLNREIVKGQI